MLLGPSLRVLPVICPYKCTGYQGICLGADCYSRLPTGLYIGEQSIVLLKHLLLILWIGLDTDCWLRAEFNFHLISKATVRF